jgi:hypothetical protein
MRGGIAIEQPCAYYRLKVDLTRITEPLLEV